MKTILKRFEALATNSRANNFKGAVIRLTAFYTLGVFLILIVFNTLVYGLFLEGIEHELHEDTDIVELYDATKNEKYETEEIAEDLLNVLLVSDAVILVLTIVVSYLLARRTLAPLGESYQRQKRFVADAAHELRTPLAVIKAGSEVLLKSDRTIDEYQKFIAESEEEVERLITISNDLLFLTQNKEVVSDTCERFSFSQICEKRAQAFQAYAQTKHVSLTTLIEDHLYMRGRQDDISRMVLNLLKNAVDYNKPDGTVRIELKKKDAHVILSIQDTGVGIESKDIPHIFERFYKADSARVQSHSSGSGLGLSIVKEIVSDHKGTITIESVLGKGTVCIVTFPCA